MGRVIAKNRAMLAAAAPSANPSPEENRLFQNVERVDSLDEGEAVPAPFDGVRGADNASAAKVVPVCACSALTSSANCINSTVSAYSLRQRAQRATCFIRGSASDSDTDRSTRAIILSGARQSEVQTSGSLFRAASISCSQGVSEFCWLISCLT